MRLMGAAGLFFANAAWRTIGADWAGRTLIKALGSKDENLVNIAGIFLAKSGEKAEPLLLHAVERKENLEVVLPLLGDVCRPEHASAIDRLQSDPDQTIARAATYAVQVMRARSHRS